MGIWTSHKCSSTIVHVPLQKNGNKIDGLQISDSQSEGYKRY